MAKSTAAKCFLKIKTKPNLTIKLHNSKTNLLLNKNKILTYLDF